ncbi:MAG: HD-GYP domain-containing protein [Planctomycetota bacterium]
MFDNLQTLLNERFSTQFEFWSRTGESTWKRVGDSSPSAVELNDVSEPRTTFLQGNEYELTIPVAGEPSDIVAVTRLETSDPQLLLNLAESVLREHRTYEQNRKLLEENREFATQAINDLEKLSFMRDLTEKLKFADKASGMQEIAGTAVLPMLQRLVNARSIYLLPENDGTPRPEEQISLGENLLSGEKLVNLAKRFGARAVERPYLNNRCESLENFREFEGLRNFIIAAVQTADQLMGWLVVANKIPSDCGDPLTPQRRRYDQDFGSSEATLLSTAATILATHSSNANLLKEKEMMLINIVRALVSALDAKDPYTCGHSERVALYGKRVARAMGMDEQTADRLHLTGLLHDIGKIGVDDAALQKPDKLTDEEFELVKAHPESGWSILQGIIQLQYVLPGVLFHHERYDGKGYPDGLSGDDIPLDARILAVVDSYDAMTSDRPYRNGMAHEKAMGILLDGSGSQWDPRVVEAFYGCQHDILAIKEHDKQQKTQKIKRQSNSILRQ